MNWTMARVSLNRKHWELKWLREALRLTQTQAAELIGCSLQTYYCMEYGRAWAEHWQGEAWKTLKAIAKESLDFNSLRTMRCRCGLSQSAAAHRLKCTQGYYQLIENERYKSPVFEQRARNLFQEIINDLEAKK